MHVACVHAWLCCSLGHGSRRGHVSFCTSHKKGFCCRLLPLILSPLVATSPSISALTRSTRGRSGGPQGGHCTRTSSWELTSHGSPMLVSSYAVSFLLWQCGSSECSLRMEPVVGHPRWQYPASYTISLKSVLLLIGLGWSSCAAAAAGWWGRLLQIRK